METINCQLRPVAGIISVSHDHVNCYIRKQKKSQSDIIMSAMYEYGSRKS